MNKEYVKNKVLGSLICAAVGDSIGAATEINAKIITSGITKASIGI